LRGEAAFTGPKSLSLRGSSGTESHEFKHCIVATGGRPVELPNIPFDGTTYVTSNEVVRWTALPASIAIIGAGVIGCEFASLYARMGVPVHVLEMLPGALPGFDEDVGREVARGLKKQGVEFYFETKVEEAGYGPAGASLTLSNGETLSAQVCVVAVGRKPNTEGLNPEKAGLKTGKKGELPVDGQCRTNVEGIYAIGDVTGIAPLAHSASHMGLVAAERIAGKARGGHELTFDPSKTPFAVFTQPEAATIGMTEAKAREGGREIKVGKFPFRALGKAQAVGEIDGFVKVIADAKTGELLGFHAVGSNATDLLGEASLAWMSEATIETLADAIHAHPTFPEAVGEAALMALGLPLHSV
ncbi:MAG: FAD-dependent oxidoreductase, partial [Planctomycetes bacterium]|nr:FAD-dependent oxidoreductase [Planctomycetota bacterium]